MIVVPLTIEITFVATAVAVIITATAVTVTIGGVIDDANTNDFRFRFSLSAVFIP